MLQLVLATKAILLLEGIGTNLLIRIDLFNFSFVPSRFLTEIMEISVKTAQQLRLTPEEFESIKEKLGRTPNFTELCAFSAMWSEHCSYKNSIKWLKTLPRDGKKMLVKA